MGQRLKQDDRVVAIAGRDKGRQGRILKVFREENRVIVEGINVVRKHQKPTPQNPEGGIIEKEMPIHESNVMLWVVSENGGQFIEGFDYSSLGEKGASEVYPRVRAINTAKALIKVADSLPKRRARPWSSTPLPLSDC